MPEKFLCNRGPHQQHGHPVRYLPLFFSFFFPFVSADDRSSSFSPNLLEICLLAKNLMPERISSCIMPIRTYQNSKLTKRSNNKIVQHRQRCFGSEEEKTCRISDKDEKLVRVRDVSPSQGLLQSEEAPERAKRLSLSPEEAPERAKRLSLSPISQLCLIF